MDAQITPTHSAHHAVARGGGISFPFVHPRDGDGQFRDPKKQIGNAAPELSGRSVTIGRRILDIGESASSESDDESSGEEFVHGGESS